MALSSFVLFAAVLVYAHVACSVFCVSAAAVTGAGSFVSSSKCLPSSVSSTISDECWGFVDVRTGAHMFYWLYGANSTKRDELPLVVWLQGGPGGSSTGFGNFEELGPLDLTLSPRSSTWVQSVNVLFIDNPVGAGWSYVDGPQYYTTDVNGIAVDLIAFLKAFLAQYPIFVNLPFFIFCESYGGKMTTAFAQLLSSELKSKSIQLNFQAIALGDSWISPVDYTNTWGPYLFANSLIDENELNQINDSANQISAAIKAGQWDDATNLWGEEENLVESTTDGVSFYNILVHNSDDETAKYSNFLTHLKGDVSRPAVKQLKKRFLMPMSGDDLDTLMNTVIRVKLEIIPDNVVFDAQSGDVFNYQSGDFMKPIVDGVDQLLSEGLRVIVYTGQLDLICCTLGTVSWMNQLTWSGYPSFVSSAKTPLYTESSQKSRSTQAFFKSYKNLEMYYILDAGHMVPTDNPDMALLMVQIVTNTTNA